MGESKRLPQELVEKMKEICYSKYTVSKKSKLSAQTAVDYAEEEYIKGVLIGLKICKEMWAQGTISHENIYENEVYYTELLKKHEDENTQP